MERRQINPWSWQDRFGYSQAWRVDGSGSTVYVAGQGSMSSDGELVGEGDFEAQARQTFANLRTVLEQAGASLENVVKLTVYLTDIGRLRDYGRIRAEAIPGPPPAGTALQVAELAIPGMLLEVDAVAVI
jgi:enamine deaminase RidA (YjgF/YER057c/UK114 family)